MWTHRTLRFSAVVLALVSGSFVFACSSSSEIDTLTDAGSPDTGAAAQVADSGHDASDAASELAIVCDYPPFANPVGCPTVYSYSFGGKPCNPIGLQCAYPGAGDGTSTGCFSTAMMWCRGADGGISAILDAGDGGDAGTGTWTIAQ
jgi:hypothetical protein